MKNAEIRALAEQELLDKINASEKTLDDLRFAHRVTPIENPMQLREMKKLVARLKTEMHDRILSGLQQDVEAGKLTSSNARQYLSESKFPMPITLAKLKKVIAQTAKK